jgi:hypothetical protein
MPMTPRFLLLLPALLLAGCVFSGIRDGLDALKGYEISTAFQVLGYPNGEQTIYGKKVYIWSTSNSFTISTPQTSYGSGYIGNRPFSYQSTSYQDQQFNGYCTIRIFAFDDRILGGDFEGNNGGCMRYSRALSDFADRAKGG